MSVAMGSIPASRSSGFRLLGTISHRQSQSAVSLQHTRTYQQRPAAHETYRKSMAQNLKREWKTGDVYAPHDLSAAEMRKWSKRHQPTTDVFDVLSINPLTLYKNFSVMSDFISDMGRIRPARETGLRPVNQRKIAKAFRRAVALGLMPSVHTHPEILKKGSKLSRP